MNTVQTQLIGLIAALPVFAVWITGIVFCALRASQQKMACILVGAAIAVSMVSRFIFPFMLQAIMPSLMQTVGPNWQMLVTMSIYSMPTAISWGLMLWAIFGVPANNQRTPWDEQHDRQI